MTGLTVQVRRERVRDDDHLRPYGGMFGVVERVEDWLGRDAILVDFGEGLREWFLRGDLWIGGVR